MCLELKKQPSGCGWTAPANGPGPPVANPVCGGAGCGGWDCGQAIFWGSCLCIERPSGFAHVPHPYLEARGGLHRLRTSRTYQAPCHEPPAL